MINEYRELEAKSKGDKIYFCLLTFILIFIFLIFVADLLLLLIFKDAINYIQHDPSIKNLTKQLSHIDLSLVIESLKQIPFTDIKNILDQVNSQDVITFFENVDSCIEKECSSLI